jgi:Secretion system C-terminal sorting domain
MLQRVTSFFIFLAIAIGPAMGQTTVRDINAIPQNQVNVLEAAGVNLQAGAIANLIANPLVGTSVTIRVVILSDPLSSGLANLTDGVNPDRIHVYVRDVAAATQGNDGMGIQVVDGQYQTTGLVNTTIGDVVDITGTVAPFGTSMQLAPETVTLLGSYTDFGLNASILAPVTVVSSDVNKSVDSNGGVQPNWSNLANLSGQFIRLEGVTLVARDISSDRPNWIVSSDGGTTVISFYDMSLRYRNDRGSYPDGWNKLDDDFVPPPPGARLNLQGFVVYQRDDPFNRGVPNRELLSIVPFADSDLEITETPPTVTNLSKPDIVPTTSAVNITADVAADPSRSLTSVQLVYTTSASSTEQTVTGSDAGGTYTFSLPAQADGVGVSYWVRAIDNTGAGSVEMDPLGTTRFLANGIDSVADIQGTVSGGPGDTPFRNVTTDMNLTVTVMTQPSLSNILAVQDASAAWSGVIIRGSSSTDALNKGDVINITNAKIEESFGLTRLRDITFTTSSTGGSALAGATLTTTALQDASIAEAYEGVFVRLENVEVGTPQADAPSDFGEFTLTDAGLDAPVRVDDQSQDFSGSFNDGLTAGQPFTAASGIWAYSFGNYKLWPESTTDLEAAQIGFTVRDINAIPQNQVTALETAGVNLDPGAIAGLIGNDLVGTSVTISVVVLSDPLSSGLANLTDGVNPDRIHVYVRDTAAAAFGNEGMGIQVVDGQYQTTGLVNTTVGDVVEITGTVAPFGTSMQLAPETVTLLGSYTDFGLPASILDPVTVVSSDINKSVDSNGGVQPNWSTLADMSGQYIRLEGATLLARDISSDRPNWIVSSDGGTTVISFYDMSLRYRNDRGSYPDGWNKLSRDFVPPPPGARINLQGFVVYQRDDPFNRGVPVRELLSIVPFADSDLEITETPPLVTDLTKPDFVPGTDPVTVTASVAADPTRTLSSVDLTYNTSDNSAEQSAAGSDNGDGTYTFTIPAQADGVFVTYFVDAEDNTGAVSVVGDPSQTYRVLPNGITQIAHIQATANGGPGEGPFRNVTTDMDITATVMSDPATSGIVAIQDDSGLAPWTGVIMRGSAETDALQRGDVINITNAKIEEQFGLTRLRDYTFTVSSTGGASLGYKVVTSDALVDPAIAEGHEGMAVKMEGVEVGTNQADAPSDFGEFTVGTAGTDAFVRVDDQSNEFPGEFNDNLVEGQAFGFIQGIWSYSFGNFKLWPESLADIGGNTSVEDGEIPQTFALHGNYPNPFNPATTIRYDIASADQVSLEVYDLLGRRVSTLVNTQQAPGRYVVSFDARSLASGVYIYRLQAGTRVFTKTMLLLK